MSISEILRRRCALFALAVAITLPGSAIAAQGAALELDAPTELVGGEIITFVVPIEPIVVPEPTTLALMLSGMAALWLVARRRRRA